MGDSMHANQSDEMNKATVSDPSNISMLVEKHMAELEELDKKYKDKLRALNHRQSASFREFIHKYNTVDHSTETMGPEQEEDPGEQKWHRRWFKLRDLPAEKLGEAVAPVEDTSKPKARAFLETSMTVSLGIRAPVLYNIELNTSTAAEIITSSQHHRKSLIKTARSMFSNSLSGLVVSSNPALNYKGNSAAALLSLNENS